jgi:ABC-2 type transport system permease protein
MAIGAINLRRFFRDRGNLFFSFVFPIAMILVIGLQFGGDATPRLGVVDVDGELATELVDAIDDGETEVEVVVVGDPGSAVERVESTDLDAALLFPPDLDDSVAAGAAAEIEILTANTVEGRQLQTVVDGALATVLAGPSAERTAVELGADPAEARAAADELGGVVGRIDVVTVTSGDELFPEGTEGFDVAAPSMVVLFVFVNGLAGSYALIQTRQLGVSTRMMSTPTSVRSIIFGEGLGRWIIGLVQGAYIVSATLLLFRIDWGDLLGAAAIVMAVAAVSAGAAMCFGTFFSNPEQASGIGVVVALGLGALGGAMMPIELFSDTLASVARLTPHYWAIDAFSVLVRHDGTVSDIWRQLVVLAGFAVALLLLASWRMRAVLTRGG